MQDTLRQQEADNDIQAIVIQLRSRIDLVPAVKAFLVSGMAAPGQADNFPRCVRSLDHVPAKDRLDILVVACAIDRGAVINVVNYRQELGPLFFWAVGQSKNFALPTRSRPESTEWVRTGHVGMGFSFGSHRLGQLGMCQSSVVWVVLERISCCLLVVGDVNRI